MHPYIIAPKLVRVNLDKELSAQYVSLNNRLVWRPLTTNLESSEDPPYLYFRITLNLRPAATTYAGFATGAPFMLTRDKDLNKRAFFLRHWVRRVSATEHKDAPEATLSHLAIGAHENRLLIRVDIDRKLETRDTFKSIPFATWMFQVVQVDAIIKELPEVRFAFAIERTVTAEERAIVAKAGHAIPAKGPKMKPPIVQPHTKYSSAYASHLPVSLQRNTRPLMRQAMQPNLHASPMQQSMVMQRSPHHVNVNSARHSSNNFPHNVYQYMSTRKTQSVAQHRAPRVQAIAPSQLMRPAQRVYSRPLPPPPLPAVSAAADAKLLHPYLKLWEDRDTDDPYEPIFLTKDEALNSRARRSVIIETEEEHWKRLDHHNLHGIPTADYPADFFDGPEKGSGGGEADIEIVVRRHNQLKSENDVSNMKSANGDLGPSQNDTYAAAVIAAAEYNESLRSERGELSKWLSEDAEREEEDSDDEDDDDEADQDSSD